MFNCLIAFRQVAVVVSLKVSEEQFIFVTDEVLPLTFLCKTLRT